MTAVPDVMSFPPLPPSPAEVGDLILQTREHVQALGWGNREALYPASHVRAVMAHDDAEGERVFHGPYRTKWDAEDAITEWVSQQKASGCRLGECESKPTGCRMAEEVKPDGGAQ